jgi:hypothetical protein
MPEMGVISANVQGDIGATGISRYHITKTDGSNLAVGDCNSAITSLHGLYTAASSYLASGTSWSIQLFVQLIDVATAEIRGGITSTDSPSAINGAGGSDYPAGNGARIDWLTSVIRNRRIMRGATFMVPLGGSAYSTGGVVSSGCVSALTGAAGAFVNALNAAGMDLMVYHRPPKGTFTGGQAAAVDSWRVPNVPATLRSRRT